MAKGAQKKTAITTTMESGGKRIPNGPSRPHVGKSIAEKKGPYKPSRFGEGTYETTEYKKP